MANDKAAEPKKKLVKGRHVSAQKRARQAVRRAARNTSQKTRASTFEKKVVAALKNRDIESAKKALVLFMSNIDKAAQKGAIHVKRAARRISRLSRQVAQLHP